MVAVESTEEAVDTLDMARPMMALPRGWRWRFECRSVEAEEQVGRLVLARRSVMSMDFCSGVPGEWGWCIGVGFAECEFECELGWISERGSDLGGGESSDDSGSRWSGSEFCSFFIGLDSSGAKAVSSRGAM